MTTSISNVSAQAPPARGQTTTPTLPPPSASVSTPHTLASRFAILLLSSSVVLSTLAFGAVHSWSISLFGAGAALLVALWSIDAWRTGRLRISRNALQWPLFGLCLVACIQLLPLKSAESVGAGVTSITQVKSISLDPFATRIVLVQLLSLLIYFAATLVFIDNTRRLRFIVRLVNVFGVLLALFGLLQFFANPQQIYWLRQPPQSIPFGPFINRHHFAGYMELTLALPLGLLFFRAIKREWLLLYVFGVLVMITALFMTTSRGGVLGLIAELLFLVVIAGLTYRREQRSSIAAGGETSATLRLVSVIALGLALLFFALYFGGGELINRVADTVNSEDVTTGRLQFWQGAREVIKHHPLLGAGLGAFGMAYTRYDTLNGTFRLEQAHNDYLQILADAGIVGGLLGLFFIIALFRDGFKRLRSPDKFRRGVAAGALAGCCAVLVHSLVEFSLHTTSNALLFLVLAALATLNGRVEDATLQHRRRRRHRQKHHRQRIGAGRASIHEGASGQRDDEARSGRAEDAEVAARAID